MSDQLYLGDDFDIEFPAVHDASGNVVPLTGATVYCDARTGSGPPVSADAYYIDDAPGGLCRARFSSATTATFTPGTVYNYDGRVKLEDGTLHTIGWGSFRTIAPVTPTPS